MMAEKYDTLVREEAQRASERYYRLLFESIPLCVFLKNRRSEYITVNPAYAATLKMAPESVVGLTDLDLFPEDLAYKYRTDDQNVVEFGITIELDEEYLQDGEIKTIHTIKIPFKDENGYVEGILGMFWDVKDRKQLESAALHTLGIEDLRRKIVEQQKCLERLAITDDLSGLLNRRSILEELQNERERSKRYEEKFGAVMVDIDFFKKINDIYGYLAGDRVLADFAAIVRSQLRQPDSAGRYGGEEFLIILPNASGAGAIAVAERIRLATENHIFTDGKSAERISITCSVGITEYDPIQDPSVAELLNNVEFAMYQSKNTGRNRVTLLETGKINPKKNI